MATTQEQLNAAVASVVETEPQNVTVHFPPPTQTWYAMNRRNDEEAEVSIYDAIGAWGVAADRFVQDLKKIDAKTIHLRLNTPGGSVFDGTAIHNSLIEHPAKIIAHVDGVAASAGSFIAMSADEVRMADNTYLMIHNARGGMMGGADEMRRYADLLEKMNNIIAGMYERKAGKTRDHWRNLMDEETWFTADEAKAEGLADVVEPATKKQASARASFDFKIYNKIPAPVAELWGIAQAKTKTTDAPPAVSAEEPAGPEIAPEPSPRGESPSVTTKEILPMSESTTTAPALQPVAGISGTVTGADAFTQQAIEGYRAQGKAFGVNEGKQAEIERMRSIVAAAPGRFELAINAFLSNQDAATVKLACDAAVAAETKAAETMRTLQQDNARLQATIATGGFSGGVPMGVTANTGPIVPQGLEPDAQAQMEWDSDPMIRAKNGGDNGKKHWLLYRVNQLKGGVRTYAPAR